MHCMNYILSQKFLHILLISEIYLILFLFIYFLSSPKGTPIDFRERGREGDSEGDFHPCERETLIGCLSHKPRLGWGLPPRMCPDRKGSEPLNLQLTGHCSNQLSHTSQTQFIFFYFLFLLNFSIDFY